MAPGESCISIIAPQPQVSPKMSSLSNQMAVKHLKQNHQKLQHS